MQRVSGGAAKTYNLKLIFEHPELIQNSQDWELQFFMESIFFSAPPLGKKGQDGRQKDC